MNLWLIRDMLHSTRSIGVEAGKFLGVRNTLPKFQQKFVGKSLREYFLPHRSRKPFGMTSKKDLHVILHTSGANFSKSKNVGPGAIFARIFRQFSQIFWCFTNTFTDFHGVSTNQNFWRCACIPASYTTDQTNKFFVITLFIHYWQNFPWIPNFENFLRHLAKRLNPQQFWETFACFTQLLLMFAQYAPDFVHFFRF